MTRAAANRARQLKASERRRRLADLVRAGNRTQAELAELLGVTTRTIRNDLAVLEEVWKTEGAALVQEQRFAERAIDASRIEEAIRLLQDDIANPRKRIQALRLQKEYLERKAKMLGLDQPIKHAATDPTGDKEHGEARNEAMHRFLERQRAMREAQNLEISAQ